MWLSISELAALLEGDAARAERCLGLWLAPAERAALERLAVPKRRRDWLAGRVAAKEAVRRRHGLAGEDALRRIEIVAPREGPARGKPAYRIDGAPGPLDLSISHSGDCAAAALAAVPHEQIGIDLEQIEARDESFEALALSAEERRRIAPLAGEARALAVTARWVLKEALSKAIGAGLRLPFERVTVHLGGAGPGAGPGDAAAVRFDLAALREPHLPPPREISARLARAGGMCVASVAIRPIAAPA